MSENSDRNSKSKRQWLTPAIAIAAMAATAWMFIDLKESLKADQLAEAIHSIAAPKLALAALATIASFVVMAAMEWLGAKHYIDATVPLRRASLFSVIVYGISNTFGFAGLASTPLRLRLYGVSNGAKADRVLSLCLLASAAFWLGLALLLGTSLIISAFSSGPGLHAPPAVLAGSGVAVFVAAIAACWFLADRGTKLIGNLHLSFPGRKQLLAQSALASLDWFLAGLALYSLLPSSVEGNLFRFLSGFLLSQIAALVSSIPGGIGVLEGFNLYLMGAAKEQIPSIAAAFIAYRCIYYLPPFILSFVIFVAWSLKNAKSTFAYAANALVSYSRSSVPMISSALAGLIGLALLINSGQAFEWMVHWSVLPPFWESLAGTLLLILAIGLHERSSSARKVSMALMLPLTVGALLHGPIWSACLLAVSLAVLLAVNGREFYRRSELSSWRNQQRVTMVVLMPVLASAFFAVLAYYRNEVDSQQWWRFTFDSNASAFLRGCVGSFVALGAYGLWVLLSPRARGHRQAMASGIVTTQESQDRSAIEKSPFTTACLALIGDKDIFRSEGLEGFVMYKVARPYWIVMGDPVCAPAESKNLMAAFLEECDKLGGTPVFYQTRPETLARYVEIGFQAVKIGEEARVHLPCFSLEGRERKTMRNTCSRIEREGYRFALLSRERVAERIGDLRRVSNEWLGALSMREKGFSIGYFSEPYITQNDVAVILKDDHVIAFANIWITGSKDEFSVDLMRYGKDAPSGVMEYLIIQLMLHAKSENYSWFNLGMAPLAGLEGIHSGRQWHRVGTMIYRAGEAFYNFRGLKAFKDKFGPNWESRFLVYPPGANLARVLSAVALLINFKGVKTEQDREAS